MTALTLVEAAKNGTGDVIQDAVIQIFATSHDILTNLPFQTIAGNALRYNREGTLPATVFRAVNEAFTTDVGTLDPQNDPLFILGRDLDVDRFIVQTEGAAVRSQREAMQLKSMAHTWASKFIKGNSATDPREFDGLQERLAGTDQELSNDSDAAPGTARELALVRLDEAIDMTDDPTALYMSKKTRRNLTLASRDQGVHNIEWRPDEFGRQQAFYADLPILISDRNGYPNKTLNYDEVDDTTSIYCLSMQREMLQGIQAETPSVRDQGEIDSAPVFRTRFEWYSGISLKHPRAATRLWHILDGTPTAS